jgi:predicted metal-dependent hydrolase
MDFRYHLIRSKKRRRTISLHIREDGRITISVPYRTPEAEIARFMEERKPWISRKLSERERARKEAEKSFLPGEQFPYLGEWYPLTVEENGSQGPPLKLSFGRFILNPDSVGEARDAFIRWYKKEANEVIVSRVEIYGHRLRLFPKRVRITNARCRWGSCSRDDCLALSWRMIMAPLSIIDYVLIHELAHIKEKNHSKRFWNEVEAILPDYRKRRLWLKQHGHLLQI